MLALVYLLPKLGCLNYYHPVRFCFRLATLIILTDMTGYCKQGLYYSVLLVVVQCGGVPFPANLYQKKTYDTLLHLRLGQWSKTCTMKFLFICGISVTSLNGPFASLSISRTLFAILFLAVVQSYSSSCNSESDNFPAMLY